MYQGSVVSIEDLTKDHIEDILDLAQEIENDRSAFYGMASQRIMASLFLEPSTRTRGSFESAMKRLGGDTITTADPNSSSVSKGESLADTIRIWSGYADLIVLRHAWEGSARLAAQYSEVPVINAGDGSHEHPTQTLLDLYTLRKEFGKLEGLKMVLCGDLKNGRTVHSLIYALLRFDVGIFFAPGEGLGLPDHVVHKIESDYKRPIFNIRHPALEALYDDGVEGGAAAVDAIYMTPSQPHSLTLFDSKEIELDRDDSLIFYVTRRQVEREETGGSVPPKRYPRIDAKFLRRKDLSRSIVMHPLPRVDELSPEMDSDPRSKYFDQAKNGVPVRMALISLMLGLRPWTKGKEATTATGEGTSVSGPAGIVCMNPACVAQHEPQNTKPEFSFFRKPRARFVCAYCDRDVLPDFCTYPRGEVYFPVEDVPPMTLDPSTFTFFSDESAARDAGMRPPQTRRTEYGKT